MDAKLTSIIERIERLEEDKRETSIDIREVYAEAKSDGYDVKALRRLVRLRAKSKAEREQEEAVLDTYKAAVGMS